MQDEAEGKVLHSEGQCNRKVHLESEQRCRGASVLSSWTSNFLRWWKGLTFLPVCCRLRWRGRGQQRTGADRSGQERTGAGGKQQKAVTNARVFWRPIDRDSDVFARHTRIHSTFKLVLFQGWQHIKMSDRCSGMNRGTMKCAGGGAKKKVAWFWSELIFFHFRVSPSFGYFGLWPRLCLIAEAAIVKLFWHFHLTFFGKKTCWHMRRKLILQHCTCSSLFVFSVIGSVDFLHDL